MIRVRLQKETRSAFTLIELLVVIAIIAILVSLTAAAVMKVLGKIPQVQTSTEIGELGVGLAGFMSTYNLDKPPPSYLVLREDGKYASAQELATATFLSQLFGKNFNPAAPNPSTGLKYHDWNGNGVQDSGPLILEGEQCLVFYLGGIPNNGAKGCLGFSTSPYAPAMPGGDRRGPFYEFKTNRLKRQKVNPRMPGYFFLSYEDPWQVKNINQVYAFFSTQGVQNGYNTSHCASIGASPYMDSANQYTFKTKYQIISAGQNGHFGSGVWVNGATGVGTDDQANFARSLLVAGQQ